MVVRVGSSLVDMQGVGELVSSEVEQVRVDGVVTYVLRLSVQSRVFVKDRGRNRDDIVVGIVAVSLF